MSIYLHFFDRELAGSVQWAFNPSLLVRVVTTLIYATDKTLYYGLSLLYETCTANNELFDIVRIGGDARIIVPVSNHPTIGEFLESRLILYKHDSSRYPVYFDPSEKERYASIDFPILYKPSSTTDALRKSFELLAKDKANVIGGNNYNPHVNGELVFAGISRGIESLGGRAITYPAFREYLPDASLNDQYFIRRTISEEYTKHYLESLNADIVTGVDRFIYYDYLAKTFPINDFYILEFISKSLCNNIYRVDQFELTKMLISLRPENVHNTFVQTLKKFIEALYQYVKLKWSVTSNVACRYKIIELLRTIEFGTNHNLEKISDIEIFKNLNLGVTHLERVMAQLSAKDALFRIALKFAEDLVSGTTKKILLCTATDLETETFYDVVNGRGFVPKIVPGKELAFHYIGTVRSAEIFLVQTQMGSGGSGGSGLTTLDAIDELEPDVIVAVGICFGANSEKQNIGDILISRQVQCYELQRVGDDKIIPRGDKMPASPLLISRFDAEKVNWKHSKVHTGLILSGDKLVDNSKFKKKLLKQEPEAIGGEMEGAGILAASYRRKVDWVIVKGICDWGEAKDSKDQALAAHNAVSYCWQIIESGLVSC